MIYIIYSVLPCHLDCFIQPLSCVQIYSYAVNHNLWLLSDALQLYLELLQQSLRASHQQEDRTRLQQAGHLDGHTNSVCLLVILFSYSSTGSLTSSASARPSPLEAPVMTQMHRPRVLGFAGEMSGILTNILWWWKYWRSVEKVQKGTAAMWNERTRAHCFCDTVEKNILYGHWLAFIIEQEQAELMHVMCCITVEREFKRRRHYCTTFWAILVNWITTHLKACKNIFIYIYIYKNFFIRVILFWIMKLIFLINFPYHLSQKRN